VPCPHAGHTALKVKAPAANIRNPIIFIVPLTGGRLVPALLLAENPERASGGNFNVLLKPLSSKRKN
jgi:hypothetical protein